MSAAQENTVTDHNRVDIMRALFKAWWDATRPLEDGAFHIEIAWRAWQAAIASDPPAPAYTPQQMAANFRAGQNSERMQRTERAGEVGDGLDVERLKKLISSIHSTVSLGHQSGPHAYAGEDFGRYLAEAAGACQQIMRALAALAARQPVGEVIEYQSYHGYGGGKWSTCDKKLYDHGKAFEAKYGSGQMSLYRALVVGDAAPPAQGIDLGRQPTPMGWSDTDFLALGNPIPLRIFRKAVMRFKVMAELGVDVESMPMHFMKSPEKYAADVVEANRLLALIDGQRDAAPGVGNG